MNLLILEDRIVRLENLAAFDLQKSSGVNILSGTLFDQFISKLRTGDTLPLEEYDCIAVHRSPLKEEIIELFKSFCKEKNKPLIFFSGGITSNVYKDLGFPFLLINSKDFYSSNLKLFIEDDHTKAMPNLLILQFGDQWKLSLLLHLRNHIVVGREKGAIKWIYDLKINPLIKNDLIDARTSALLSGSEYTSVSHDQVSDLLLTIDHLINEAI